MKIILACLTISYFSFVGLANAQEYDPNSVIVKYKPGFSPSELVEKTKTRSLDAKSESINSGYEKLNKDFNSQNINLFEAKEGHISKLTLEKGNVEDLIANLKQSPGVEYVEPNYRVEARLTPTDPFYFPTDNFKKGQWYLPLNNMEKVWDIAQNNGPTYIAIFDSGVSTHLDIKEKIEFSGDCTETPNCDNSPGYDDSKHGTWVAGVAGATQNNWGITGINNTSKILSFRVLGKDGGGTYSSTIGAINTLVKLYKGKKVIINMSYGTNNYSRSVEEALQFAFNEGFILVGAASNHNISGPDYPNGYQNVISVGSIKADNTKTSYSNFGTDWVDVTTYGGECNDNNQEDCILSLNMNYSNNPDDALKPELYSTAQGNSFASPMVAGVAGLVWSTNPNLTNSQVVDIIQNTADKIEGTGTLWKYGKLNPFQAVKMAKYFNYDLDGDYQVGALDLLTYLDYYLAVKPYKPEYDFNSDGENSILDLLKMLEPLSI